MDKIMILLILLMLAIPAFCDSDLTGILAGTKETLVMTLTNSSGLFDSNANCSLRIMDASNNAWIVVYSSMGNYGDGRYYYDWSVPQNAGLFYIFVNCTTIGKENVTKSASVFVRQQLLEKSVAKGVVKYEELYAEEYGKAPIVQLNQTSNDYLFWVSLLANIILVVALIALWGRGGMGKSL